MPSHLSSIGFDVQTGAAFERLAERVARESNAVRTDAGSYLVWECSSGAQLWLQATADGELIGMNPHFQGASSLTVKLTRRVSRERDTPLDGAFYGWAVPDAASHDHEYPFAFDCPDFACLAQIALPIVAQAQVSAFALSLRIYSSLEDLNASRAKGGSRFADRHFVPSGLFSPGGATTEPPNAIAIFGGYVRSAEERQNRLSGKRFVALEVDSLAGKYSVAADRSLVGPVPTPGSIIAGQFWLTGRLVPDAAG